MTNTSNIHRESDAMYSKEEDRCRSLVCDPSGIIVAEMVYRCMICFCVSDTMKEARLHYQLKHMEDEEASAAVGETDVRTRSPGEEEAYASSSAQASPEHDVLSVPHLAGPFGPNHHSQLDGEENFESHDESDSFEQFSPSLADHDNVTMTNGNGNVSASGGKSGYVNCAVCGVTRFYSCVQRRYGQFTCVTCYRYFRTFLLKPKKYACPNLGSCMLNVRTRCRACWLMACIEVFSVDMRRQKIVEEFRPLRKLSSKTINNNNMVKSMSSIPPPPLMAGMKSRIKNEDISENANMHDESSTIMVSFNSGDELPSILDKGDAPTISKKSKSKAPSGSNSTPGKKIWSCGKCVTCMAEDCGKCIYCLDRPKFGGPFIKKQRCIKRRCLMKIKNKNSNLLSA